jgi:hypothetical protein
MSANSKPSERAPHKRGFLPELFSIAEAPWAVSLAIGGVGWTIVRVVDSIVQSPSIEYSVDTESRGPQSFVHVLHIKNISRTKEFSTLSFFMGTEGGKLSEPQYYRVIAPARLLGGENGDRARVEGGGQTAVFPITQLQPGWALDLKVSQTAASVPKPIIVSVFSGPYTKSLEADSKTGPKEEIQAVRLIPASLETFIVSNEVSLLCVLLICWIVVIALFVKGRFYQLRDLYRSPSKPEDSK